MKLLLFSDVHHDHTAVRHLVEKSEHVDVVVGAGDFAVVHQGLTDTINALREISKPAVLVPGNAETFDELEEAARSWKNAQVCHGHGIQVEGVNFFGLGGGIPPTPWDWSFDLTEQEARTALAECPTGGVLVLHSPPRGYVDTSRGRHLGSEAILETIERCQPVLAVCGHIHDCWGQEAFIGPTRLINAGPQGLIVDLDA